MEISYFRSRQGFEVDFIARPPGEPPQAIQVTETLAHPKTRQRELRALEAIMQERGVVDATLITRNEETRIDTAAGTVRVVPAWRWLLED